MKKISYVFISLSILFLTSCDWLKDASTVDVDTELKTDVPLETTEEVSASFELKSVNEAGDFTGSAKIDLEENDDLKAYINNLKKITADDVLVKLNTIPDEMVITTMTIKAEIEGGASNSKTLTQLTKDNALSNMSIAEFKQLIDDWDITSNHVVTFSVTGNASQTIPTNMKAQFTIPATVGYQLLD